MIAAMGEGEAPVLHAEAEAFATQRDYRFVKFSPATGRGICNTVSSLVELVHGARDKYSIDQEGYTQSTAFQIGYYLEFDHISAILAEWSKAIEYVESHRQIKQQLLTLHSSKSILFGGTKISVLQNTLQSIGLTGTIQKLWGCRYRI
ncbi:hypothetical protein CBS147325_9377 [Penicillium roqueforti]|nr:hypothetical protein CBS147325_9377 [Penicillium roqueforti]